MPLEGEAKTELERANVFTGAPVGIVAVVKPDGTDREFVTQSQSYRVAHVIKTWIFGARQKIAGVKKRSALQFAVNRESVFHIEDGKELAANRIVTVVWSEVALDEAANGGTAAIEESFVDRNVRDPICATQAVNDASPCTERQQRAMVRLPRFWLAADRLEIRETRGAPDEIDLASNRTRGKIQSIIENQAAARIH